MKMYFVTKQDSNGIAQFIGTNVDRQAKLYRNLNGPRQVLSRHGGGSIWSIDLESVSVKYEGSYGFKPKTEDSTDDKDRS